MRIFLISILVTGLFFKSNAQLTFKSKTFDTTIISDSFPVIFEGHFIFQVGQKDSVIIQRVNSTYGGCTPLWNRKNAIWLPGTIDTIGFRMVLHGYQRSISMTVRYQIWGEKQFRYVNLMVKANGIKAETAELPNKSKYEATPNKMVHDFDTIHCNKYYDISFFIKNTGHETWVIRSVKPSSNNYTTAFCQKPIPPGDSCEIQVLRFQGQYAGGYTKSFLVTFSPADTLPPQTFTLKAYAIRDVEPKPLPIGK